MALDRAPLSDQMKALMDDLRSLPQAENDEQRQALAGLDELARVLGEMSASAEAFLNKHQSEDQ